MYLPHAISAFFYPGKIIQVTIVQIHRNKIPACAFNSQSPEICLYKPIFQLSENDVCRRQILTAKVGPRTKRVKSVILQFMSSVSPTGFVLH